MSMLCSIVYEMHLTNTYSAVLQCRGCNVTHVTRLSWIGPWVLHFMGCQMVAPRNVLSTNTVWFRWSLLRGIEGVYRHLQTDRHHTVSSRKILLYRIRANALMRSSHHLIPFQRIASHPIITLHIRIESDASSFHHMEATARHTDRDTVGGQSYTESWRKHASLVGWNTFNLNLNLKIYLWRVCILVFILRF